MQEAMESLSNGIGTMCQLNPELDLDYFTCGLLKYIPLDYNSMIFSGGLLFDAYYARVHETKSTYDLQELKDIDLFLFGSEEIKISNVQKIVGNLQLAYGAHKVFIGVSRAVCTICIVGLPRIVQIICTNYEKPEQVIDNFDMAHVAMYYSDKGFHATPFAKLSVQIKQVLQNPKCSKRAKPSRLIKYKSRGMDISEYIKEFPFNIFNPDAVYKKTSESLYYRQTKNLTIIGDKDIESDCEDVEFIKSMKIFLRNKLGLQFLTIDKDNSKWVENIEWFGDFEYLQPKENFLSESNQIQIDSYGSDEFYSAIVHKTPSHSSLKIRNLYSDLMVTGKIAHVIKEAGGISEYFYYMIWTVEDPDTIELVKQAVKVCVDDLAIGENSREFYETGILDSLALSNEERVLYNVENFPHDKYANAELTEKVNQCAGLSGLYLFSPVYPEKFHPTDLMNMDNNDKFHIINSQVSKCNTQSLKLDKFFQDIMGTDICIVTKVKNVKTGSKNSVLSKNKRARTCFAVSFIC